MPDPDQMPESDPSQPATGGEPRIDDSMAEAMLGAAHDTPPEAPAPQPTVVADTRPPDPSAVGVPTAKMSAGTGMGGMWQPPSLEEAAQLFPTYEVLSLLGRGGMGAVYKARQIELDRFVAIKLLPLEISVDADFADRFRREARAMAKLSHPNIIAVHEFGKTSAGHLFFVMEFVDGANLHAIIHGPGLNLAQALALTIQICEALAFAHEQGVVHRDIKPANVMVDQRSRVKVADFGLARLTDPSADQMGHTMTGTVMGTPDYMAPEQMKGMNVDHRADIYSLGVMLYEMLCKDVPRGFFDPPSERVGVDARLDEVVKKAMQQQPERRYQQTGEMKADVDQIHTAMVQPTPSLVCAVRQPARSAFATNDRTAPSRGKDKPRMSRGMFIAAIFAGLLVIVGPIVLLTPLRKNAAPAVVRAGPLSAPQITPPSPTSSESAAIKVWSTAAEFTPGPGKTWENDSVCLSDTTLLPIPKLRDVAIRASIRTNPDARDTRLGLRRGADNSEYGLTLNISQGVLVLHFIGPANKQSLRTWKLPRSYRPDEWVNIELRAVGDELTTSLDGKVLGTVHDTHLGEPGGLTLHAIAAGYFRDIVYVPLDKPASASMPVARPTANADWQPLAAAPAPGPVPSPAAKVVPSAGPGGAWVDGFANWWERNKENEEAVSRFVKEAGGWRVAGDSEKSSWGVTAWGVKRDDIARDAAIRATVSGASYWRISLREDPDTKLAYIATLTGNAGSIAAQLERGQPSTVLKTFAPPAGFVGSDPHTMEFRAQGGVLLVLLDGKEKLRLQDDRLKAGIGRVSAPPGALIEKLEYQILDSPAAPAPAPPATSASVAASKEPPFTNSLGMKFVPVPIVGGPTDGQRVLFSVWETRVQDYDAFIKDEPRNWQTTVFKQGPTEPAVMISWEDAQTFCAWLTERERKAGRIGPSERYRLPSDHEWSCAVGIGNREDPNWTPKRKSQLIADIYPWGSDWPPSKGAGNFADETARAARVPLGGAYVDGYSDGFTWAAPVGSFPANAFGLFDLAGNAKEWCRDWLDEAHDRRVQRGSGFDAATRSSFLSAARGSSASDAHQVTFGFRCVLAPSEP